MEKRISGLVVGLILGYLLGDEIKKPRSNPPVIVHYYTDPRPSQAKQAKPIIENNITFDDE